MKHATSGYCPSSIRRPRPAVDADGFCQEHGWDCGDFREFALSEQRAAEINTPAVLIGFGGRKRAGKDAAAEVLEQRFGFYRESVSLAIDLATRELNPIIDQLEGRPVRYDEYVDVVCQGDFTLAKKHPEVRRFLEQTGGFGRSIAPNIWIDRAEERVIERMTAGQNFALTGVRFPEEIEMVRRHGGLNIWISRPDHEDTSSTAITETSVGPEDFDLVIVNDGTLDQLATRVEAAYIEHRSA